MRIEIPGVPRFYSADADELARRMAYPAAQVAQAIQVLAGVMVNDKEIVQVRKVQVQPFQVNAQGAIVVLDEALWWKAGAVWGPAEVVPYFRWVLMQENNPRIRAPAPLATGAFLPIPAGTRDPIEVLLGNYSPILPPSEITAFAGSQHLSAGHLYVQGPRMLYLFAMHDQTARIAHAPLTLLAQPFARLEVERIPEVLVTPPAAQHVPD